MQMKDSSVLVGESTGCRVRLTRVQKQVPLVGEALDKLLGMLAAGMMRGHIA